jgi:hypothetical protein
MLAQALSARRFENARLRKEQDARFAAKQRASAKLASAGPLVFKRKS